MATPFLFSLSMLAGVMEGVREVSVEYMMDIVEDFYFGWLSNNMEGTWVSTNQT